MKLLEENIRKNGFGYRLLVRGERAFIYEQWDDEDNFIVSYEVFTRRVDKEKEVFGELLPEREVFPGNADFGVWAWSIRNLEKAYEKYYTLESGEEKNEDSVSQGFIDSDSEEEDNTGG